MAENTPLAIRAFMRAYPWRRIDPVPWTPLAQPLSQCRLALVSSAAQVPRGQQPFDVDAEGGDCTFREVPSELSCDAFEDCHPSDHFDHSGLLADLNVAFPLDRARELVASGRVGDLAPRHLSFCGAITATGRLRKESAPLAARSLAEDGVDVALLFPV